MLNKIETFKAHYHSRAYKIAVLAPLLALALVVVGNNYFSKSNAPSASIQHCSKTKNYSGCLSDLLLDSIDKNPAEFNNMSTLIVKSANSYDEIDLRGVSEAVHTAGMNYATQSSNLMDAASTCGETFRSGCLHGFVMDSVDRIFKDTDNPTTLINFCDQLKSQKSAYENCIHGIGHVLWGKSEVSLNETLGTCKSLAADQGAWAACTRGIFMEYTKDDSGKGHHSHQTAGSRLLPCEGLDKVYQEHCYASAGSYRQYVPGIEPYNATYGYCRKIPSEYLSACSSAISDRIMVSVGDNIGKAKKICTELDTQSRRQCLDGLKLLE